MDEPEDSVFEVAVRFGSRVRAVPGSSRTTVALPGGATVADLVCRLVELDPELAGPLESALTVVDGRQVLSTRELRQGDLVAFLLPVAGG